MEATTGEAQAAADTLGVALHVLQARTEPEFDGIFVRLSEVRVGGIVIAVDSFFTAWREQLGQLALRHRVPAIYQSRAFAEAGGVMSYGGRRTAHCRPVRHCWQDYSSKCGAAATLLQF